MAGGGGGYGLLLFHAEMLVFGCVFLIYCYCKLGMLVLFGILVVAFWFCLGSTCSFTGLCKFGLLELSLSFVLYDLIDLSKN